MNEIERDVNKKNIQTPRQVEQIHSGDIKISKSGRDTWLNRSAKASGTHTIMIPNAQEKHLTDRSELLRTNMDFI